MTRWMDRVVESGQGWIILYYITYHLVLRWYGEGLRRGDFYVSFDFLAEDDLMGEWLMGGERCMVAFASSQTGRKDQWEERREKGRAN